MNVRHAVLLAAVVFAAGFSAAVNPSWSRSKDLCHNCIEDGGHTKHACASGECDGGDNCFEGCDHTTTVAGGCFTSHDFCPAFLASNETILTAVSRYDGKSLRALLAAHPTTIIYNEERAAIQVLDCGLHVIDHLPVPPDLAVALNN